MTNGVDKFKERWRRAPAWLGNKLVPGGLILMYHRIVELPLDPFALAVTPQHFAEHLEVIRKYSHPISLSEMARSLKEGKRPHRAVVVTFDDGYTDNLYNAKPLLERAGVPGTVFITTGQIGSEREFFWDELERLLLEPGRLPETLKLQVDGSALEWDLGAVSNYQQADYLSHTGWNTDDSSDPTLRHTVFRLLHQLLKPLPRSEQQKSLEQLLAWSGREATARPTHRTMTMEEVRRLADGDLVTIGSHTVTHPTLSALTPDAQRTELEQSKARLEEILERPARTFAYPFGGESDYTAETIGLLKEIGYDCACSYFPGVIRARTDRYQLPRIQVKDWDGDELARLLRWLALG
jgi:peptidoglycan/xylan/chitin deacetylase (PgdA/CDA1 family)